MSNQYASYTTTVVASFEVIWMCLLDRAMNPQYYFSDCQSFEVLRWKEDGFLRRLNWPHDTFIENVVTNDLTQEIHFYLKKHAIYRGHFVQRVNGEKKKDGTQIYHVTFTLDLFSKKGNPRIHGRLFYRDVKESLLNFKKRVELL